jgi:hypothetical protein
VTSLGLKQPTIGAKELGSLCLQHLAENPEQLAEFMSISGITPDGLRRGVGSEGFNSGLIDYFVSNESLLVAFCKANQLSPEAIMRIWAKLNPAG